MFAAIWRLDSGLVASFWLLASSLLCSEESFPKGESVGIEERTRASEGVGAGRGLYAATWRTESGSRASAVL